MQWGVLKPDVFATVMDFFASNLPVMNEEALEDDAGKYILGASGAKNLLYLKI